LQKHTEVKETNYPISKSWIVKIIVDALLLGLAYNLAYLLRFDFNIPDHQVLLMERTIIIAILMNVIFINLFKINQSPWRYAGMQDVLNIIAALTAGWICFILYLYFANLMAIPRSVLTLFWIFGILLLGTARFSFRFLLKLRGQLTTGLRRVLIIGAGNAGEMIIRQMKNDPTLGYRPVAIADDNPKKWDTKIHGVRVLGSTKNLAEIIRKKRVDEIIISTPSAHPKQMRAIVHACEATGLEFKTVPGPKEIVDGNVKVNQLRKVKIEDLLDRTPVEIDLAEIEKFLNQKNILITGAGGSIGSELSRQILGLNPGKLICLDRSENSLFYLDYELQQLPSKTPFEIIIADILDTDKMSHVLRDNSVDIIFHAAAYKHVPLMERHPEEAIRNNVLGTLNLIQLSEKYGVDKFVLISTDKAVNPTSIMGATKRVAELILQSYSANSQIKLLTVRFGNVLGSYGSVIPLFQKQIANGGPVTITDTGMTRFFMTIPESVQLILQAARMSAGNDIFVLDMGEPIKLINIARRLIKLSGLEPDKDIPIKVIGTRPGEKLHEELWSNGELPLKTDHPKIFMAVGNHYNHWDVMGKKLDDLFCSAQHGDLPNIINKLQDIVPDYRPDALLIKKISRRQTREVETAVE
jgi:FlaA1/EpsC-like NDP-sugar epimerase